MRRICYLIVTLASAGSLTACGGCGDDSSLEDLGHSLPDSALRDSAGPDTGHSDTGQPDTGSMDAGADDTAVRDGFVFDGPDFDTGVPDANQDDAGVDMDAAAVRGTCSSPADCGGRPCVAIPNDPNGWHTCLSDPTPEVTACNSPDEGCCMSSECMDAPNGRCYAGPLFYCGGAPPFPHNDCWYDQCAADSDCTDGSFGVCLPAQAFGEVAAVCSYGDCSLDTDCASRAGGLCMPFFDPCNGRFGKFSCTYDDSPCRSDADCTAVPNGYCAPGNDGNTSCETFVPPG